MHLFIAFFIVFINDGIGYSNQRIIRLNKSQFFNREIEDLNKKLNRYYPQIPLFKIKSYRSRIEKKNSVGNPEDFHWNRDELHCVENKWMQLNIIQIVLEEAYRLEKKKESLSWMDKARVLALTKQLYGNELEYYSAEIELSLLIPASELLVAPQSDQNPFLYLIAAYQQLMPLSGQKKVTSEKKLEFQRGVSFAHTNGIDRGYGTEASFENISVLKGINVNTVSITPFIFYNQAKKKLHFILNREWDETEASLFDQAEQCKAQGISVFLKPHLWVSRGIWSGDLSFTDPLEAELFFAKFREAILYYARIADLLGADFYAIATETGKLMNDSEYWKTQIRDVRKLFGGFISYCANWYGDYESITFWSEFDFIGIQAYFPLAEDRDNSVKLAKQKLTELKEKLEKFAKDQQKAIIFTEIGFSQQKQTRLRPHEERKFEYDETEAAESAELYLKFFHQNLEWFKGFFWWKWQSANIKNDTKANFNIRYRKIEKVIAQFYKSAKIY